MEKWTPFLLKAMGFFYFWPEKVFEEGSENAINSKSAKDLR
jgi:hypothetical protein